MQLRVMFLALVVVGCGISTSPSPDRSALEGAARATDDLERYSFEWAADYQLSEPDETGRDRIAVSGSGVVDTTTGTVDASFLYDPTFADSAQKLFADDTIREVESFTRMVGEETFVRGWNVAFIDLAVSTDYHTWYRVTDQNYRDAFSSGSGFPAEVIPVIGGLLEAGERTGATYTAVVDRDAILDLGDRFPASLVDFQLRIGGDDFVVTGEISNGYLERVTLKGDDPGAGVEDFTFTMSVGLVEGVVVALPSPHVDYPEG